MPPDWGARRKRARLPGSAAASIAGGGIQHCHIQGGFTRGYGGAGRRFGAGADFWCGRARKGDIYGACGRGTGWSRGGIARAGGAAILNADGDTTAWRTVS